jgi:glycosyltransferase involved in cell wall biosynthesis
VETTLVREMSGRLAGMFWPINYHRTLSSQIRARRPDVVHDHGVWRASNWSAGTIAARFSIPLIVTPRGMLTKWALRHHRWKKKLALSVYQNRVLRGAAVVHATSEFEAEQLRTFGMRQPIAIIANGVDIPTTKPQPRARGQRRRALFMSRLHPMKGVPMLLEAWARIVSDDWTLEIAGPDEGNHLQQLEQLAQRLQITHRVEFSGNVNDEDKWSRYATADLFILPSHNENFGIAVAEALASGVPVITTSATPWSSLPSAGAGWCVAPKVDSIEGALRAAIGSPPDCLRLMGDRGRRLVEAQYSWRRAALNARELYSWILGKAPKPEFVVTG